MLTIQIAGDTGFENYVSALTLCGARSVLSLSPGDESGCAGLLLPGGGDVDPSFYHQENCGSRDIDRSRFWNSTATVGNLCSESAGDTR